MCLEIRSDGRASKRGVTAGRSRLMMKIKAFSALYGGHFFGAIHDEPFMTNHSWAIS
jgi:hypothetical protein